MRTIAHEIYFDVELSDAERKAIERLIGGKAEVLKRAKLWVVVKVKPKDK